MDKHEYYTKICDAAIRENIATLIATMLCVGIIAHYTHSLHAFWGLLILLNINDINKIPAMDTKNDGDKNEKIG